MVLDQAHDFTGPELKRILERNAEGSKIIVLGDTEQTMQRGNTRIRNGLTYAIKTYLPRPETCLIRLERCYRTGIAEHAINMRVE